MEMEKVIRIGGEDYPEHIVKAYKKAIEFPLDKTLVEENSPNWFQQIITSDIRTFQLGYNSGYEVASSEAPDCDECDVHAKAAERGPPENHHSQQDR